MHRALLAPFVIVSLASCATPAPEVACDELVTAFTEWVLRCDPSADPGSTWEAVEAEATDGLGCAATISIRDERALWDECIPALRVLSCDVRTLPAACEEQLLLD